MFVRVREKRKGGGLPPATALMGATRLAPRPSTHVRACAHARGTRLVVCLRDTHPCGVRRRCPCCCDASCRLRHFGAAAAAAANSPFPKPRAHSHRITQPRHAPLARVMLLWTRTRSVCREPSPSSWWGPRDAPGRGLERTTQVFCVFYATEHSGSIDGRGLVPKFVQACPPVVVPPTTVFLRFRSDLKGSGRCRCTDSLSSR